MSSRPAAKEGRTPVIGILGAVASGKSMVAAMIAAAGAELIDADRIGHEVLELPDVKRKVQEKFGETVFTPDGAVSREALGRLVFANHESLEKLNAIVHPIIIDIVERRILEARQRGAAFVVLDAALLMDWGLDERCCDVLVFVDAEKSRRRRRAQQDRGWSPDQVSQREAAQMPIEAKKQRADFVIDNNSTPRQLEETVRALMDQIREKTSA